MGRAGRRGPADVEVDGGDADLAAVAARRTRARVCVRGPTRTRTSPGPLGLAPVPVARQLASCPIDGLRLGPVAAMAVNAVVLGAAARPPAVVEPRAAAVGVDGRRPERFEGRATTVVVANGQFLRGADVVPRGHPGDGRVEVQVYALAPGGAAGDAAPAGPGRPRPAPPHPRPRVAGDGAVGRWPSRSTAGAAGLERPTGSPEAACRVGHGAARSRARCRRRSRLRIAARRGSAGRRRAARRYHRHPMQYVAERFTDDEAAILRPYFTNLDGPVFALVNLPEVVKGALFARYSRSPKSLRRLFLDEFVGDLDLTGDLSVDATVGLRRAEELYDRVFLEYGDDSVAQLGGVHLACEQASNLLTKVLEWGRLMAYLEQSTRYIPYDDRARRPLPLLPRPRGARVAARRALRRRPRRAVRHLRRHAAGTARLGARARYPKEPGDSDFVYKQTIKAKACDAARGHPARGDAVERRHLRHRPGVRGAAAAHARPSAARGAPLRRR